MTRSSSHKEEDLPMTGGRGCPVLLMNGDGARRSGAGSGAGRLDVDVSASLSLKIQSLLLFLNASLISQISLFLCVCELVWVK